MTLPAYLPVDFIYLILQLVLIYLISRCVINELFLLLLDLFGNQKLVYNLLALFFLPGTIIHELSHFLAATVLFLRVRSFSIWPQWQNNHLKLGSVVYEKKDLLRSILVGIAPLFGGLAFFLFLANFNIFPQINWLVNLFLLYLIFVVSVNMFSSKKDLQDLLFLIPLSLIAGLVIYIFNLPIDLVFNNGFWHNIIIIFRRINIYLLLSLGINLGFWLILKFTGRLIKKS